MSKTKVAFIGTGKMPVKAGPLGYAMAYRHGEAYEQIGDVEMVAAADIVEENGRAFADRFGFTDVYEDYHSMLAEVKPDMVSICTWPHLHERMVIDCAEAGVPAVHCEKPVADTYGAAKRMVQAAEAAGMKLTFNHQRRYGKPFYMAKELLDAGAIGQLQKIEIGAGNLYDYGSHNFDMANYFNGERDTKWMLANVNYTTENFVFGAHNENDALALWEYENGVFGLACCGAGSASIGCHHRLIGSDGMIEIGRQDMPVLRVLSAGKDWEAIDTGDENCHGPNFIERCIADVVECLREGRESQMNARNALRATEQIFAAWESARRRGIVIFPLDIEDNPLAAMVESGDLKPAKA